MLYIYTDQGSVRELVKDIPNIRLVEKTSGKWIEDFSISSQDKILLIGRKSLYPIKNEKHLISSSKGYNMIGNKIETRFFLTRKGISVPRTYFNIDNLKYPCIARPARHSVNRYFHILRNDADKKAFLKNKLYSIRKWYYSDLIDVDKEFRVMIMDNEIFLVYNRMLGKDIEDTLDIRNQARRTNSLVRYECQSEVSKENLNLCLEAMKTMDVGYGAVDLIVDKNGRGYIVEVNSTPFLNGEIVKEAFKNKVAELAERYK